MPGKSSAQDVTFPSGGRIGLTPPASFKESDVFTGFRSDALNASIVLNEVDISLFDELKNGLNADAARSAGLFDLKEFKIAGLKTDTLALTGYQVLSGQVIHKWIVIARSDGFVADIVYNIPDAALKQIGTSSITNSLDSIKFRNVRSKDPVESLPFQIEIPSSLKYKEIIGGFSILTKQTPPPPGGRGDDISIYTGILSDTEVYPADQEGTAEKVLRSSRAIHYISLSGVSIIAGMRYKTFSMSGLGFLLSNNRPTFSCLLISFDKTRTYFIMGTGLPGSEAEITSLIPTAADIDSRSFMVSKPALI